MARLAWLSKSFEESQHPRDHGQFASKPGASGGESKPAAKQSHRDKVTSSPAFKKWFGDSKVVGEDGKPLVVYHGTSAEIHQFSKDATRSDGGGQAAGKGFYFATNSDMANEFNRKDGGNTLPVYLRIESPFDASSIITWDRIDAILSHATDEQKAYVNEKMSRSRNKPGIEGIYVHRMLKGGQAGSFDANETLKKAGYDGIVHDAANAQGSMDSKPNAKFGKVFVAFSPHQIKSATGNAGTFDPDDADTRKGIALPWLTKSKDASGHEHAADGRFGTTSGTHKPAESKPAAKQSHVQTHIIKRDGDKDIGTLLPEKFQGLLARQNVKADADVKLGSSTGVGVTRRSSDGTAVRWPEGEHRVGVHELAHAVLYPGKYGDEWRDSELVHDAKEIGEQGIKEVQAYGSRGTLGRKLNPENYDEMWADLVSAHYDPKTSFQLAIVHPELASNLSDLLGEPPFYTAVPDNVASLVHQIATNGFLKKKDLGKYGISQDQSERIEDLLWDDKVGPKQFANTFLDRVKEVSSILSPKTKSATGNAGTFDPEDADTRKGIRLPWLVKSGDFTGVSFGRYYINGEQVDEATYKAQAKQQDSRHNPDLDAAFADDTPAKPAAKPQGDMRQNDALDEFFADDSPKPVAKPQGDPRRNDALDAFMEMGDQPVQPRPTPTPVAAKPKRGKRGRKAKPVAAQPTPAKPTTVDVRPSTPTPKAATVQAKPAPPPLPQRTAAQRLGATPPPIPSRDADGFVKPGTAYPPKLPARPPAKPGATPPPLPHARTQQDAITAANALHTATDPGHRQQAHKAATAALERHRTTGSAHIDRLARAKHGDTDKARRVAEATKRTFHAKLDRILSGMNRHAMAKGVRVAWLTKGFSLDLSLPGLVLKGENPSNHAPTGGMTSNVNGQWYDGGEFMPITGEYCGTGKNRITKQKLAEVNAGITDAEIIWNEKANVFQLLKSVKLSSGGTTKQVQFSAANIKTLEKLTAKKSFSGHVITKGEKGRWITIGGSKGKDGKRKGGSPVYIENGRITRGHPSLTGKKLDNMKGEADHGSTRSQLAKSRGHAHAKLRKAAKKAGHNPEHVQALADEIRENHNAFSDDKKALLKHVRSGADWHEFSDLRSLKRRAAKGDIDANSLKGFDQIAENAAKAFPQHFKPQTGENGSHADQLFEMLTEGDPELMTHEDAFEQALEHFEREKQPDSAKDDDWTPWDDDGTPASEAVKATEGDYPGGWDDPIEDEKPAATDWRDTARSYKDGGVIDDDEASGLRSTYADLDDDEKTEFAKHFNVTTDKKVLPDVRDDLVERKIREMAKRGSDGPAIHGQHKNRLFGERGVGESDDLFGDVEDEPAKPKKSHRDKQTSSPEFKKWFSDSKVVDESGKPKVMYHGTWADFNEFDTTGGNDLGSHFGNSNQAGDFGKAEGGQTHAVYLSIKNPLRLPDVERWNAESMIPELKKHGIEVEIPKYEYAFAGMAENYMHNIKLKREAIAKALRKAGHDGIVYQNNFEGGEEGKGDGSDSYIVFSPHQIKSAIGNSGKFDASDADTRKSIRLPWLRKTFNESDHPRDHGQFASKPGASGEKPSKKPAHAKKARMASKQAHEVSDSLAQSEAEGRETKSYLRPAKLARRNAAEAIKNADDPKLAREYHKDAAQAHEDAAEGHRGYSGRDVRHEEAAKLHDKAARRHRKAVEALDAETKGLRPTWVQKNFTPPRLPGTMRG